MIILLLRATKISFPFQKHVLMFSLFIVPKEILLAKILLTTRITCPCVTELYKYAYIPR